MKRSHSALLLSLIVASVVSFTGCGEAEPFDYVPVKGTVTWDDGTPIKADYVEVTFYSQTPPKDPKINPRPGVSIVNPADGTFTNATSHKPNDGIVPGKHKVTVTTFDKDHMVIKGIVPPEYEDMSTTPLEFDTTTKTPADFKVKKK